MKLQNWKSIAYVIAIFLAGAIAGAAVAFSLAHPRRPAPRDMQRFLTHRLNLTPEQVQKVDPILDKLNSDLDDVRRDARQRAGKLIDDTDAQISAFLTPEQKAKMAELQQERKERMRHRHPPRKDKSETPPL